MEEDASHADAICLTASMQQLLITPAPQHVAILDVVVRMLHAEETGRHLTEESVLRHMLVERPERISGRKSEQRIDLCHQLLYSIRGSAKSSLGRKRID